MIPHENYIMQNCVHRPQFWTCFVLAFKSICEIKDLLTKTSILKIVIFDLCLNISFLFFSVATKRASKIMNPLVFSVKLTFHRHFQWRCGYNENEK